MSVISIVIADDHVMLREGLRQLLETQSDIKVVGEANDGIEALDITRKYRPDILVLDISMPRMNGIEAVKIIRDAAPETRIVILSMFQREIYAHQALEFGAHGYVLKGSPSVELLDAIRTVHSGRYYFSHSMQVEIVSSYLKNRDKKLASSDYDKLTEREKQVFMLLIEGNSTTQIGNLLCVSNKTIEKHRARVSQKLGLSNPVEMMKFAIRSGIVDPESWKS